MAYWKWAMKKRKEIKNDWSLGRSWLGSEMEVSEEGVGESRREDGLTFDILTLRSPR